MRLALGLATLGVVLGAIAWFGYLSAPGDAGDVEEVELALASSTTTSTTMTAIETEGTLEPEVEALWSANEVSLLGDLTETTGPAPVGLKIDKLGIDAQVGAYGVDSQGRMDVPDNITEVGWYEFGPSPGEAGSAVLAAHVDLAGPGRGLFYDLDALDPGDIVSVTYSDGSVADFEVDARSVYLKSDLPLETIFSRNGKPVLTLVTCGGAFSRSANSYDSNVVVYAVPVDGTTTLPSS